MIKPISTLMRATRQRQLRKDIDSKYNGHRKAHLHTPLTYILFALPFGEPLLYTVCLSEVCIQAVLPAKPEDNHLKGKPMSGPLHCRHSRGGKPVVIWRPIFRPLKPPEVTRFSAAYTHLGSVSMTGRQSLK